MRRSFRSSRPTLRRPLIGAQALAGVVLLGLAVAPAVGAEPTCTPTTASAQITVHATQVEFGEPVRVTGSGWCHPIEGASRIAVKIDDGDYSRLDASLATNRTIWALIDPDPATGDFDVQLMLPDGGTTGANGSTPALPQGAHSLRFLTGSLKVDDATRSVLSPDIVVGTYRPNGVPAPVDAAAALTHATRSGVVVAEHADRLDVHVGGAVEGDWVYLSAYDSTGSVTVPWGSTWFQTDAFGNVTAPLAGVDLPTGEVRLVVQSGNPGEVGTLRGWTSWNRATPAAPGPAAPGTSGSGTPATTSAASAARAGMSRSASSTAAAVTVAAPETAPPAPVEKASNLTIENTGAVVGEQDGALVTLTLAGAAAGDWVYVYAYTPEPVAVGWASVDAEQKVTVDFSAVAAGLHQVTVSAVDGTLIGWAPVTIDGDTVAESSSEDDAVTPTAASLSGSNGLDVGALDWWLGAAGLLALVAARLTALVSAGRPARASVSETGASA